MLRYRPVRFHARVEVDSGEGYDARRHGPWPPGLMKLLKATGVNIDHCVLNSDISLRLLTAHI